MNENENQQKVRRPIYEPKFSVSMMKLTLKWSRYSVLPLVVKGGPYGT